MHLFLHKLVIDTVEHNDHYLDVNLYDLSPKAALRWWRFTYDTKERRYYAMLMRAAYHEASFDHDVTLPRSMADQLWQKCLPFLAERRLVHGY